MVLHTNLYECLPSMPTELITTDILGMAFEPEQLFENPDGTPIVFDTDFYGKQRAAVPLVGPFEEKKGTYKL